MGLRKSLSQWYETTKKVLRSPLNPPLNQETNRLTYGTISIIILSLFSGLFYSGYMAVELLVTDTQIPAAFGSSQTTALL